MEQIPLHLQFTRSIGSVESDAREVNQRCQQEYGDLGRVDPFLKCTAFPHTHPFGFPLDVSDSTTKGQIRPAKVPIPLEKPYEVTLPFMESPDLYHEDGRIAGRNVQVVDVETGNGKSAGRGGEGIALYPAESQAILQTCSPRQ